MLCSKGWTLQGPCHVASPYLAIRVSHAPTHERVAWCVQQHKKPLPQRILQLSGFVRFVSWNENGCVLPPPGRTNEFPSLISFSLHFESNISDGWHGFLSSRRAEAEFLLFVWTRCMHGVFLSFVGENAEAPYGAKWLWRFPTVCHLGLLVTWIEPVAAPFIFK